MIKYRQFYQFLLLILLANFTIAIASNQSEIASVGSTKASGKNDENLKLELPNSAEIKSDNFQNMTNKSSEKSLLKNNNLNFRAISFPAFDATKTNEEIFSNNLPRNFRDLKNSEAKINAIASGQFSEEELASIKKKYPNEKIIIVDLRLESHLFANGKSIAWKSEFDSENLNKNYAKIIEDESNKAKQLTNAKRVMVADSLIKDEKNGWYSSISPIITEINSSKTEQQLAKEMGFEYRRIPIRDHAPPTRAQLNQITTLISKTNDNTKIYVHRAAGKGRTTTFLTIMDIMKNAKNNSFEEIIKRQHKLGGSRLDKIDQDSEWRQNLAKERLELLKNFYQKELIKDQISQ